MDDRVHRACKKVLRLLSNANKGVYAQPFLEPVPRDVPGYYDIITRPMDLSTITKKLGKSAAGCEYEGAVLFKKDVELMLNNAFKFNAGQKDLPGLTVYGCAKELKFQLQRAWKSNVKPLLSGGEGVSGSAPKVKLKIKSSSTNMNWCIPVLEQLMMMSGVKDFIVSHEWDDLYKSLIPEPSSLESVRADLTHGGVHSPREFVRRVKTVFTNCLRYYVDPVAHKSLREAAFLGIDKFNNLISPHFEGQGMDKKQYMKCRRVMEELLQQEGSEWFVRPAKKYGIELPSYDETIVHPMDLGRVQERLAMDKYSSVAAFSKDVSLVFSNCVEYNEKIGGDEVMIRTAKQLDKRFNNKLQVKLSAKLNPKKFNQNACKRVLKKVMKAPSSRFFLQPVDWEALNLPQYPLVIKKPMDLGTVKQNLERGKYKTEEEFAKDVRLVFTNCLTFNTQQTEDFPIRTWCMESSDLFESLYAELKGPEKTHSWKDDCRKVLDKLMKDKRATAFNQPFDYKAFGLLDYPKIVKQPMDFLTIREKRFKGYQNLIEFVQDMELVFHNCLLYNKDQSKEFPIRTWCIELRQAFRKAMKPFVPAADSAPPKQQSTSNSKTQVKVKLPTRPVKRSLSHGKSPKAGFPKSTLLGVLDELSNLPAAKDFRAPVPWKDLGLDDYLTVVKKPMDLQTVRRNLNGGKYGTIDEFKADVALIFSNCLLYNKEETIAWPIRTWAKELNEFFHNELDSALKKLGRREEEEREEARRKELELKEERLEAQRKETKKREAQLRLEAQQREEELKQLEQDMPPPPPPPPKKSPPSAAPEVQEEQMVSPKQKQLVQRNVSLTVVDREESEWEGDCRKMLERVLKNDWANRYFREPVLKMFPDEGFRKSYLSVIDKPMDFSTILKRLAYNKYTSPKAVMEDVELVFRNAEVFNSDDTDQVSRQTKQIAGHLRRFSKDLFLETPHGDKEERKKRREERELTVSSLSMKHGNVMKVYKKVTAPSRQKECCFFMDLYDWRRFNKPDYPLIVKTPMAFTPIRKNVQSKRYDTLGQFAEDVRLIFSNSLLYNKDIPDNALIRSCAINMSAVFEQVWADFTIDVIEKFNRKTLQAKFERAQNIHTAPQPRHEPRGLLNTFSSDSLDLEVEPATVDTMAVSPGFNNSVFRGGKNKDKANDEMDPKEWRSAIEMAKERAEIVEHERERNRLQAERRRKRKQEKEVEPPSVLKNIAIGFRIQMRRKKKKKILYSDNSEEVEDTPISVDAHYTPPQRKDTHNSPQLSSPPSVTEIPATVTSFSFTLCAESNQKGTWRWMYEDLSISEMQVRLSRVVSVGAVDGDGAPGPVKIAVVKQDVTEPEQKETKIQFVASGVGRKEMTQRDKVDLKSLCNSAWNGDDSILSSPAAMLNTTPVLKMKHFFNAGRGWEWCEEQGVGVLLTSDSAYICGRAGQYRLLVNDKEFPAASIVKTRLPTSGPC